MITPNDDKQAFKNIILKDKFIMDVVETKDNILVTKYGTDILNSVSKNIKIFIYMGTPEKSRVWQQKGMVYRVAVVGKRTNSPTVDSVAYQIVALFGDSQTDLKKGNSKIGESHIPQLLDPPLELESDPALYIVETSFVCYETIFNPIKN